VQRAGAELQLAVGAHGDLLDDRVTMQVLAGESEQDVEGGGRQHPATIAIVDTLSKAIDGPRTRMVRYGPNFPAARRRGGVPGRDAGCLRRAWTAGPALA